MGGMLLDDDLPGLREEALSAEMRETRNLLENFLANINKETITQLKTCFESPDLSRVQMLHSTIEEVVNSYNQQHPQKTLTILDVYTWIFGDRTLALQKIKKIEDSKKDTSDEEQANGRIEEVPYEEKNIDISQPCNAFLEVVKKTSSDKINPTELSNFFSYLQNLSAKASASHFEKIRSILIIGTIKLQESPQKTEVFVKRLITSIKTILNTDPAFKNYKLFNEEHTKESIFFNYGKSETSEGNQIMSNVDGEIQDITVILPAFKEHRGNFFNTLAQLLMAKSSNKNFILKCVYTDDKTKEEFKLFLQQKGISDTNTIFIPQDDNLSITSFWARDGAVRKSNGTIVEPSSFRDGNDRGLGKAYKNLMPIEGTDLQRSSLYFEGGNMRASKNILFVGYDDIARTMGKNPIFENDEQKVIKAFENEFGKKVIVIGEKEKQQPIFHIDMFITPLDDNTIMVADSIDANEKNELNKISKDLLEKGFNVVRVPFFSRSKLFITYNNALIECYPNVNGTEVKKVYLPQYYGGGYDNPTSTITINGVKIDLEAMNKKAVEAYQSQGFEVVPIQFPTQISALEGALNCITFEDRKK